MADAIVDIASFFSYRGFPFPLIPLSGLTKNHGEGGELIEFDEHQISINKDYEKYDLLGRPIFQPSFLNDIHLPNAVVTVSCVNKIVSTGVSGRKGSVHETINTGDYNINIKGLIVKNDSNEYPIDVLEEIHNLFLSKETIILKNQITDKLDIEKVLIKSFTIPRSNKQNVALFELNLISDFDYELILS